LLVVSAKLVKEKPEQVQALVKTWFEVREFMTKNPQKADEIWPSVRALVQKN